LFYHVNKVTLAGGRGNPKRRMALTTQLLQLFVDLDMLTYKNVNLQYYRLRYFVVCYFCCFSNIIFLEAIHLNLCK